MFNSKAIKFRLSLVLKPLYFCAWFIVVTHSEHLVITALHNAHVSSLSHIINTACVAQSGRELG